jgi:hypothetical protein
MGTIWRRPGRLHLPKAQPVWTFWSTIFYPSGNRAVFLSRPGRSLVNGAARLLCMTWTSPFFFGGGGSRTTNIFVLWVPHQFQFLSLDGRSDIKNVRSSVLCYRHCLLPRLLVSNSKQLSLHETLTVSRLVKKWSLFYATRSLNTVFTRTHHLSVSWARSIQYTSSPSYFLKLNFNIVVLFKLRSLKCSLSFRFPH